MKAQALSLADGPPLMVLKEHLKDGKLKTIDDMDIQGELVLSLSGSKL